MKRFLISSNDAGQRVDKFLGKAVPLLPRSLAYKYLRIKRIKRNGKRCDPADKLEAGDVLELYINDEFFLENHEEPLFLRAPEQLSIVYEDENILLADKPAGLLVHEDDKEEVDTLINRILCYLYKRGEYDPRRENSFVPALCNRIDQYTSGIVIAAKNADSLRILNEKIRSREVKKSYLCLVHGIPEPRSALLRDYLVKDSDTNTVSVSHQQTPGSKTILTKYRVLKTGQLGGGPVSLVEVELKTGRTHQIRAHMAFIGHPLVGDTKYGRQRQTRASGFTHQALCSYRLEFAFNGGGGALSYLNGKVFQVREVPFARLL